MKDKILDWLEEVIRTNGSQTPEAKAANLLQEMRERQVEVLKLKKPSVNDVKNHAPDKKSWPYPWNQKSPGRL